jgi:hypothetical protein
VPWWSRPSRPGTAGSGSSFWPPTCGRGAGSGGGRPVAAGNQRPVAPATTAGLRPQAEQLLPEGPEPATILPTSIRARLASGVLWQRRRSAGSMVGRFDAPGRWRVLWSFNYQSFAKYGGATSSCLGPRPSRRSRCSALGSGDGASCGSLVAAEVALPSSRCVTGGRSRRSHPSSPSLSWLGICASVAERTHRRRWP